LENQPKEVLKLSGKKIELQLCPSCKQEYLSPKRAENALSRKDNKTLICSNCGTVEALNELFNGVNLKL